LLFGYEGGLYVLKKKLYDSNEFKIKNFECLGMKFVHDDVTSKIDLKNMF